MKYPSGATLTYAPNTAGRMLSAVDSGNGVNYATSASYGPDSADCSQKTVNGLTKFWGNGYTYDAWGNLIAKGNLPRATSPTCTSESMDRTADAQNRLHVQAGADFQYDAAGNMIYNATSSLHYSYDQETRITGAGRIHLRLRR